MKISPQQVQLITKLYRDQKADSPRLSKNPIGVNGDKVTISEASQEMQAVMAKLATIPDTRADMVAKLRRAIEGGTYQVSSREVAEKFLERVLVDKMLEDDI